MLRLISILLAPLLMLQSLRISFSDLVQLDELLEHARYHEEQFGDNFITFLSKHYGSLKEDHAKKHGEEKPQHEQLPFQQHSHLAGIQIVMLRQTGLDLIFPADDVVSGKPHFYYFLADATGFKSGIFQPPKQA
jgi:hypothetical protein